MIHINQTLIVFIQLLSLVFLAASMFRVSWFLGAPFLEVNAVTTSIPHQHWAGLREIEQPAFRTFGWVTNGLLTPRVETVVQGWDQSHARNPVNRIATDLCIPTNNNGFSRHIRKPINPERQAKSRQFLSVDTLIFVYYYSRLLVQREISRRHAGKCKAIDGGGGSGVCLFNSLCVIFVV